MLNWNFTLITTLLLTSWSSVLASQLGDGEEDFFPTVEEDKIFDGSSFDHHSLFLSGRYAESSGDVVDWKCLDRNHDLDLLYQHLDYLNLDEHEFDNVDLPSLIRREAKKSAAAKQAKNAPASKPANSPPAAKPAKESKADKKAQENTAKANKKVQNDAKKAKDNTAKADKKAKDTAVKTEKQNQKDRKLVKDNLALEKKAQDKAGVVAKKKLDGIQKKSQKDNVNEDKKYQNQQRKLQQTLSKSEQELGKQKGKKGEQKASQNLAKAKAAAANLPDQHKAKVNKLYQQTMGAVDKNRAGLEKGLTKAHNDQFDASGKAKKHQSVWSKIGTAMSYLGPALLSFIPGVGAAVMGAMTAGRAASAGVQAGVKEGVKTGVKQGTKQGTKEANKKGPPPVNWKVQQADQIKVSQQNKDSNINAFERQRQQMAQAMKPKTKRDMVGDSQLTPQRIYNLARRALLEDMIWDDLGLEET